MIESEKMNVLLHDHREQMRLGKTRSQFASELLGDSFRTQDATNRSSRNDMGQKMKETFDKPPGTQVSLTLDSFNFSQEFALHRDFRSRYASTPALRRRGVASARQKHFIGRVFHKYVQPSG
jgi:hypothetical protein